MKTPSDIASIVSTIRARLNARGLHLSLDMGEEIAAILAAHDAQNSSRPHPDLAAAESPVAASEPAPPPAAQRPAPPQKKKAAAKPMALPKTGKVPFGILKANKAG